ncbi:hypothetical protein MKW92_016286 [Papaver armeniacum]|nr:hypothetical protein MKW92_016286 [Papaver armeniacum]
MIDDEIYSNGGGEDKRSKPNLSSGLLDVEVYAGLYSGRTKVTRLMFISDKCDIEEMKLQALGKGYEEIKKGENINLFKEVLEKIDGKLGSEYCLDQTWVDIVDRKAEVRKEKLEIKLNAYKPIKKWGYLYNFHLIHYFYLQFLETGPELANTYPEVIAPQDVATYGGLCALSSFDRADKVIDNFNFRNFLELVPEVREIINDFYSSRYASCLEFLENLKANYMAISHQYTHPFVSVDLRMMADAFKTDVSGLEKELEALITDNQIQFVYLYLMLLLDIYRLDSHNKILYAQHTGVYHHACK